MKRITVLLADDNKVVRKEFGKILELEDDLEVIGEAKNGHEAVAMAKKSVPTTKVLMLSAHSDEATGFGLASAGALRSRCRF